MYRADAMIKQVPEFFIMRKQVNKPDRVPVWNAIKFQPTLRINTNYSSILMHKIYKQVRNAQDRI